MRDPFILKYDIIIICHFSHDYVKHPSGRTSGSATDLATDENDAMHQDCNQNFAGEFQF